MLPQLDEKCLDSWLADFDRFGDDFLRYCYAISKAIGYYPHPDFEVLRQAHAQWVIRCREWTDKFIMKDSDGLSHLKIMSALLTQLALRDWVKELEEYDTDGLHDEYDYAGTPDEQEELKRDIVAGRGTFLGYQFVSYVLCSFEASRDDKIQKYEYRMTQDLEHDLMVFLLWERGKEQDILLFEMSTFLFFKALFARDSKADATAR